MIIDKTTPVDLTGLTRRDILDIERDAVIVGGILWH